MSVISRNTRSCDRRSWPERDDDDSDGADEDLQRFLRLPLCQAMCLWSSLEEADWTRHHHNTAFRVLEQGAHRVGSGGTQPGTDLGFRLPLSQRHLGGSQGKTG